MYVLNVKESVKDLPDNVTSSRCGTNGFRVNCDTTGMNQTYTLCQSIVKAKMGGRLDKSVAYQPCSCALDKTECPAIHMMLAEKKAGRILFYEHYDPNVENYPAKPMAKQGEIKRSWFKPEMLIATTEVVEPKADVSSGIQTINRTEQKNQTASKPTVKQKPSVAKDEPVMSSNIYETAMMDAYKNEETNNATQQ